MSGFLEKTNRKKRATNKSSTRHAGRFQMMPTFAPLIRIILDETPAYGRPSIELNAQGGFFGVWFSGVGFPNNMAWKL